MNTLKVHIVEDEIIIAYDLQDILAELSYIVNDISMSVEEVLKKLPADTSDLFIIDINLKGNKTGLELGQLLHEMKRNFIYMSSTADRNILEQAKRHVFIEKPFELSDLVNAIDIATKD